MRIGSRFRAAWTAGIFFAAVALLGAFDAAKADEEPMSKPGIVGTWIVESAELGGVALSDIEGAELVLSENGEKTLTLPSGAVEKGTYKLDEDESPAQIDATTEGNEGTQRGIYSLEGDSLKMCFAFQGPRPKEFPSKAETGLLLLVFERGMAKPASNAKPASSKPAPLMPEDDANAAKPSGSRPFRMGFTGFVYDITPEAVAASRKFVRENGDLIAHHIEGAPWGEMFREEPYPKALLDEWKGKKEATPKNGKVYLAISPGRGELKLQDKAGPLPDELKGKAYDDPLVMKTYLAYCRRAIEFFEPDWLCIGIEVNEIRRDGGRRKWDAYAALHAHVYDELKKEFPDLPIFASFTLHSTFQDRGQMLESFQALMPKNDLVAVSYYPFFVPAKDRLSALDWMTDQFDRFDKPYAMVETNDTAERLPLPQLGVTLEGDPRQQAAYYRRLFSLAQERDFAFVVLFIHQDYDALWTKIAASSPELFKAWRDCGLLDQDGEARPAYQVWKEWFALSLEGRD